MISKLEIKRQIFHMATGIIFAVLLLFNIINEYHIFLFLCISISLSYLSITKKIPGIHYLLMHFDRPKDRTVFPGKGAIYIIIGILLSVVLFEKQIALAAIMILALGDSIGPLIGHFGRFKHPFNNTRYFEGLIAGIIAGFVGAWLFVPWTSALVASVIAMTVESIDEVKGMPINDNIVVPLIAGIILMIL